MKKIGLHSLGAFILASIAMQSAFASKTTKYFECYSDQKIPSSLKAYSYQSLEGHEFTAVVSDLDEPIVRFIAKRNFLNKDKKIQSEILSHGDAKIENAGKYLVVQSANWSLALAPHKKRASLYSANPDINEIPMFCLSEPAN